ncbi:MAG TPA: matrixin family metalloprotease, partial [Myxococcota bacterium]
ARISVSASDVAPAAGSLAVAVITLDDVTLSDAERATVVASSNIGFIGSGISLDVQSSQSFTFAGSDSIALGSDDAALRNAVAALDLGGALPIVFVRALDGSGEPDAFDGASGDVAVIPNPTAPGTSGVGVLVAIDAQRDDTGHLDTTSVGRVVAHEVGHALGLFHTSEADGVLHDPIADTPECPASADADGDGALDASECGAFDADNAMFWTASGSSWSSDQALILQSSLRVVPAPPP